MAPTLRKSLHTFAIAAVLLTAVSACDRSPPPPAATTPAAATGVAQSDWPGFVDQFIEAYFVENPSFAAGAGAS